MVIFPVDCQAMGIDTRVKSRFSVLLCLCQDASAACFRLPKLAHACYEVMGNDNDNITKSVKGFRNADAITSTRFSMGKTNEKASYFTHKRSFFLSSTYRALSFRVRCPVCDDKTVMFWVSSKRVILN